MCGLCKDPRSAAPTGTPSIDGAITVGCQLPGMPAAAEDGHQLAGRGGAARAAQDGHATGRDGQAAVATRGQLRPSTQASERTEHARRGPLDEDDPGMANDEDPETVAADAKLEMEHMELFRDPIDEGEGVEGGVVG